MLRVNARQGAPTDGNSVIESLLVGSVDFKFDELKFSDQYFPLIASFTHLCSLHGQE